MAFILEYRGVFRTLRSGPIIRNVCLPRVFGACALALGAAAARPAAATSDFLADIPGRGSSGWGLVSTFEQSPYRGGGVRIDLMPLYLYEGEHIYWHSYRGGLKLDFGSGKRAAAFLSHRSESYPVERIPASLAGMSARVAETDIGASYEQRFEWGNAFGEVLRDVSHNSGGTEWRLGAATERRRGRLKLAPHLMLAARNARLNDYYYGVRPSEAATDRPAYQPGGGVNASVGLNARYDLTDRWHFLAGVSATLWAGGVRRSPIVEDRVQLAAFGGVAYEFTPTPPRDDRDRVPLSFKVLHGRSSNCNLLPIMELRCRSIGTDDRTSVDSFEVGWPFIETPNGWPVAIAWYAGLLRHEERGLQPDFMQVNLYLKAFYWGFPWSERVRTRIGFGGGFSYAQAVPSVEARDQGRRGRNTSKLLQYLDPTIDLSVGDLFGSRELRETYFGLGVSHRSGMFGMAQIFDNVNGGSNFIYTYLEWKM
ncbi:MAG TPA: MipA/OmpV family protein [Burkholderiales bacterium]|jgi:MipA family protein|nr:MipA/OmpV family protein [Burkholderiales bacterium]